MFFSVYSLGCKLNLLENEAIADSFRREGFTFVPWGGAEALSAQRLNECGILVINTCTVTSMAEQKARRVIRKALREHPEACLVVTGCYAQMEKAGLEALESELRSFDEAPGDFNNTGRLFVIPGELKASLLDLPAFLSKAGAVQSPSAGALHDRGALSGLISAWLDSFGGREQKGAPDGSFRFRPEQFSSHSRGFLKIQDGCDRRCAYCRVSLARGKSRSLGAGEALKELRSLEERGFGEVVITGVNISQYRDSSDPETGIQLPGLLDFLLKGTEKIRLRLSSIEPDGLTDGFFHVIKNPRIRPHFHLSVQSGSAEILSKMGRIYTPDDVERALKQFHSVREDPFLACDIIAGFPGESDAEFEKTFALCERAGFAWIHAFPFSRRPGTAAYDFPGKVSEREAVKRVERLTELARKGRRDYVNRWMGKDVEAVVEAGKGLCKGFAPVVSENYLKLLLSCGEAPVPVPGSLIRCRILQNSEIPPNSGPKTSRFDAQATPSAQVCRG